MSMERASMAGRGKTASKTAFTISRGFALFLAAFTLTNLVGELRAKGFDSNLWWIDLRGLPMTLVNAFLACSSLLLIGFAFRPACTKLRRILTSACLGLMLVSVFCNCVTYYSLAFTGAVKPALPVPISFLLACGLCLVLWEVLYATYTTRSRDVFMSLVFAGMTGVIFTFAQMVLFGKTDYRRPADVAVVFGARAYGDGRLSDALKDRVDTACGLYRQGLVGKLIMSGGPGDGAIHETAAMAREAILQGVRAEDIILDKSGLNTQSTVDNTRGLFGDLHASRVLVVSHAYHLPRIKLAYQRAGISVYTVPARESYFLRQMPYNMAREVAAFWVYYLRPLASRPSDLDRA